MTVCSHVENFKLSHKKPKVVGKTITWLKQEYKIILEDVSGEMNVHQVNFNNYLSMTLDYTEVGTFKVRTIDYID